MNIEIKQLVAAMQQIAQEKNLDAETVRDIVEQALAAAFRRDYGSRDQEVRVTLDESKGSMKAFVLKEVVDEVEDESVQISEPDAQKINSDVKIGETVEIKKEVTQFGRVAAQTAKQVILQKLREAEREIILSEYQDKIGSVLSGNVQRVESRLVRVDIGRATGILPVSEQIQGERYSTGQRIKVYLKEVERTARGPQLILSRANREFIENLFESEVPEMENGAVEIKALAREAGVRTKIAVSSTVPGVDPVGTFVGGHGTRVQAVMSEIGDDEKIDIIMWDEDIKDFIANALSPTEVISVEIDQENRKAAVRVKPDQLSVAIGKGGQNVRLASKLVELDIDIVSDEGQKISSNASTPKPSRPKSKKELEASLLSAVEEVASKPEDEEKTDS